MLIGKYTTAEAAKKLQLTRQEINRLVHTRWSGHCERLGGSEVRAGLWLIPAEMVDSYIPRRDLQQYGRRESIIRPRGRSPQK